MRTRFTEGVLSVCLGDRTAQLIQFHNNPMEVGLRRCIKNVLTVEDGQQLAVYEWEGSPTVEDLLEICGSADVVECVVYLLAEKKRQNEKVTAPIAPTELSELAEAEDDRIDAEYNDRCDFPYAGYEVDCGF